jgi:hypothetical protein
MKRSSVFVAGILPFLMPGFAQSASPASGNGPFVVPTAAAYNDLRQVAKTIRDENPDTFSHAKIIIYDQQAFGALSMYPGGVLQVRDAMKRMCEIAKSDVVSAQAASDELSGAGAAASGLGALISAVTPAFAIQGQSFTIDNNALIAVFVKTMGQDVVIPAYLPAAIPSAGLGCTDVPRSGSFTSVWKAAEAESLLVKAKLDAAETDDQKKQIQAVLDAYQAMRDGYLSTDKGSSLYSKISAAETLWNILRNSKAEGKTPVIIDMKIDSAGIDSTTRTVLFWRNTKFSDNVLAHYFVFVIDADNKLSLKNGNIVIVATRDKDVHDYTLESKQDNRVVRDSGGTPVQVAASPGK